MSSSQRLVLVVLAQLIFGAIVLARFLVDESVDDLLLLLTVPIALFAVATGLWGGLIGGAVALAVFGVWDGVYDEAEGAMPYVARATTFLLLGGLVGFLSNVPERGGLRSGEPRESEGRIA